MNVLLLVHPQLDPRKMSYKGGAEKDVWKSLERLGHQVEVLGLQDSIEPLRLAIERQKTDFVFNLLEEFRGEACFDLHPVAYLESLGIPFSGCNPRGLALSRPKHVAKAFAKSRGYETPQFILLKSMNDLPEKLNGFEFPMIVKLNREDASRGMSQKNIVNSRSELKKCCERMWKAFAGELIVEAFIPGGDVTIGLLGNQTLKVFKPRQLHLPSLSHISSEVIKFSSKTRFKQGIRSRRAILPQRLERELEVSAKALFSDLELSGYARFDFRLSQDGTVHFLEANSNPNIAKDEDFAISASEAGINFDQLIFKILKLGREYRPRL